MDDLSKAAKALGRAGGKARAAKLSPEQRSASAKKASEAAAKARQALSQEERSEKARRGGLARQAKLSAQERSALARLAGKAGGRGRAKTAEAGPRSDQTGRSKEKKPESG